MAWHHFEEIKCFARDWQAIIEKKNAEHSKEIMKYKHETARAVDTVAKLQRAEKEEAKTKTALTKRISILRAEFDAYKSNSIATLNAHDAKHEAQTKAFKKQIDKLREKKPKKKSGKKLIQDEATFRVEIDIRTRKV